MQRVLLLRERRDTLAQKRDPVVECRQRLDAPDLALEVPRHDRFVAGLARGSQTPREISLDERCVAGDRKHVARVHLCECGEHAAERAVSGRAIDDRRKPELCGQSRIEAGVD